MGRKRIRDNEMQVHGMGSGSAAARRPSALVSSLLKNYFAGHCSAAAIQEICYSAMQDGADHPDIQKLSRLGTSGVYSGHMARDLDLALPPSTLIDALAKVPLRTMVNNRVVEAIHRIVLPHRLFASMYLQSTTEFQKYWFGNDREALTAFWRALPERKRPEPQHMDHTIPLKLFGDGVAVLGVGKSWSKTMLAFLLTPLQSGVSGKESHILLTTLWKAILTPQGFAKFWQLMSWSLTALSSGLWPSVDMFGRPFPPGSDSAIQAGKALAGPFRGRIVALTGDLEFLHSGYGLQNSNSLRPCSRCRCDSDAVPWTDTLCTA